MAYKTLIKAKASITQFKPYGLGYAFVDRHGHGLEQIINLAIIPDVEDTILRLLDQKSKITWHDIINAVDILGHMKFQIQAIVLKHQLHMQLFPMIIRRLNVTEDRSVFEASILNQFSG